MLRNFGRLTPENQAISSQRQRERSQTIYARASSAFLGHGSRSQIRTLASRWVGLFLAYGEPVYWLWAADRSSRRTSLQSSPGSNPPATVPLINAA